MNDPSQDLSFSISSSSSSINPSDIQLKNTAFESSLDSYSIAFNKADHNFTTSSEVSFINLDDEQFDENPLTNPDLNETFVKAKSRTIINIFTGKPISPNPFRKLCSKNIQHQIETDNISIQGLAPALKPNLPQQDKTVTRQSRRDMISSYDDDDPVFEQCIVLQEDQTPMVIKDQQHTPLQRQRKKRNSLKDTIDNRSSSDECIQKPPPSTDLKINRFVGNDSSWYRLADVYTSEESDEKNRLFSTKPNLSFRLKSDRSSSSSSTKSDDQSSINTDRTKTPFGFLESLSERVAIEDKHPDAKRYFLQFGFKLKEKRQELSDKLLNIFNHDVFSSQLSDKVTVTWSGRLTVTAGYCTTRRITRTAVITLSHKVCDSPERCRDTLLHEMCHAAVTLIDGVMEHGHGPLWTKWTNLAARCYPKLPHVSIRHTYDVIYKFIYRCTQCQHEVYRHSRSLNIDIDVCGLCMGKFELTVNNNYIDQEHLPQTPEKKINRYNLYVKENFQVMKQANPQLTTPQLMKQLSTEYKKKNQQQNSIDLPDLTQLKL